MASFLPWFGADSTSSSSLLTNLQKLLWLGASGNMCHNEWHWMISYICNSSSTAWGIQQTDDKCSSCWSWFSSTHARHSARAHFPGVRRRPHILLCRAVIVPNDSAVVTYTVTVDCGLSFTLLYIFDCSENATATAELGRNARYQAHPASVPSTGHRTCCKFISVDWGLASCDKDSRIVPLLWYVWLWSH